MLLQPNRTKAKLQAGQPVYGVISTSDDPQFAELCGIAGFDYYLLDAEHGLIDPAQAVNVIRACERVNITPLVRIGSKDPKLVLQYLDAGMLGVMMPGLESAAEVKMLVDAVKYPPQGRRGVGMSRASGYMAYGTSAPDYLEFSNAQTLVIPQFEDPALFSRFEEVFSLPGVDAVMIGPRDLSLAAGFPDGAHHPEVQSVIEGVIAACRRCGLAPGITAATRADSARQVERGAQMILAIGQNIVLAGAREFLPD
jgi:4-hydroxy-2-oxoheptanedioate aldolase